MDNIEIPMFIDLLKGARSHTLTIVDSVPETHRFRQLAAGKATPAWLLGHLARSTNRILLTWTLQRESLVDDALDQLFAPAHVGGMPPSTNPADYPAWDELKDLYIRVVRSGIEGLSTLEDADLARPLPVELTEYYRNLLPSIRVALKLIINHDAYHRGQMGLLAKLS